MKIFARVIALVLAAALSLAPVFTTLAEEPAATADPAAVLATVNGVELTRGDVEQIASNLISNYAQYGYDTTDPAFLTSMNQLALDYAIQLELMEQKAAELGLDQLADEEKAEIEAETAANWANVVEQYLTYYGGLTEESTGEEKTAARANIISMLESMGFTEQVLLENAMQNAVFDKVEAEMIKDAFVSDEDIQAAFDERVKEDEAAYKDDVGMYEYMTQYYGQTSYYIPEGYRGVTHILLQVDEALLENYQTLNARLEEQQDEAEAPAETEAADSAEVTEAPEEPVTQEEVDAAYQAIIASVQTTIDEINQKLADGAAFADLVAEYGTDPGMTAEPTKSEGYSVHMDSVIWDPAFVKAAFSVNNIGETAAPVVGSYGVHLVHYLRDVPSGAIALTDDVKAELREELMSMEETDLFNAVMDEWKAAATIVYTAEAADMLPESEAEPDAE